MERGCPRTHDREQIAKELIEWAKLDDSLNLCGFAAKVMITGTTIMKWAREDPDFGQSYELAKQLLGDRREKKLAEGKLHVKAYDLNAHTYDPFLKAERREEKRFDAEIAKDVQKSVTEDIEEKMKAIHDQIAQARKAIQNNPEEKV